MDDVFNKIEMELISKAISTVVELGVSEGKITNEEEKEDVIEDAVRTIIAYKTANYGEDETLDAEDLGEFMGQYAIYKFIDLDDEELNEIGLTIALAITNVNDFEEVAKLNTIDEVAKHYKTLDLNDDSIETVATLKRLYEIIDDEKELEEFFALVNE